MVQDMPPAGGYDPIRYRKAVPPKGPSGVALFATVVGVMSYGFYQVIRGNQRRNRENVEKQEARRALIPLLQAEEDLRYVEAHRELTKFEASLGITDPDFVPGESVYKTRWMPPYDRWYNRR